MPRRLHATPCVQPGFECAQLGHIQPQTIIRPSHHCNAIATAFKQRCNAPSEEYLPHRPTRTNNREADASRKKSRPTPKGQRLRWPYLRRSRGRAAPGLDYAPPRRGLGRQAPPGRRGIGVVEKKVHPKYGVTLLPLRGALITSTYPGRCPGLCTAAPSGRKITSYE